MSDALHGDFDVCGAECVLTLHESLAGAAIPHTATAWQTPSGAEALFSLAYQTTLLLFTMNAETGQTVVSELKQHTMVPKIFSSITGALR